MSNFKQKLARFFYGRYGADDLYRFLFLTEIILLVLATVCNVLGHATPIFGVIGTILYVLAIVALAWSFFRSMSRQIAKRQKENQRFLRIKYKVLHPIKSRRGNRPYDTVTHVFRNCPKCNSVLRLPREKGKHTARCPRCDHRFSVKIRK